jgi:uncharacterized membrane protein YagU involved in acid resistance
MTTAIEPRRAWDVRAAGLAGINAGLIFVMLEMILMPRFLGDSPWMPPRMIAAIVMGQDVLSAATFDSSVFLVALVVHLILSLIYAVILAAVVHQLDLGMSLLVGAIFGLVLYFVNFYAFTVLFPWFATARNWVSIVSHLAFGIAAAWTYKGLAASRLAMRTTTPVSRYQREQATTLPKL